MASQETPEAQEGAAEKTQKQKREEEEEGEEGETNDMPVQEGSSNLSAVLLYDHGKEQYHLLRLPAGDRTAMNNKPILPSDGLRIGSVEGGWLILYNTFSRPSHVVSGYEDQFLCSNYISLLDPLSGMMLDLPPEPCFLNRKDYKPQLVADVITANCSPESPEFFVVAFFLNSNRHWLAFCGIDDESWTRIADIKHIRDASVLVRLALALDDRNKLLYFLHLYPSASNYDLMVFDFKDSKNIKMKRLVMAESESLPREGIFSPARKGDGRIVAYLNIGDRRLHLAADSSCGDLFMLLQKNDVLDGSINVLPVESFRVFIKVENGVGPQWKEIHDLGDRSIFVSNMGSSRVISIAELNAGLKSEKELFISNCVYFALQNGYQTKTQLRRDIGVFSLADRRIKRFHLPFKFHKVAVATLWWFDSDDST